MSNNLMRANLRFIAAAMSALAGMALCFLLLAWGVGGTEFFRDDLLGLRVAPLLIALGLVGAIAAHYLGDKPASRPGIDMRHT